MKISIVALVSLILGLAIGRFSIIKPPIEIMTHFRMAPKLQGDEVRWLVPGYAVTVSEGSEFEGGKRIAAARCETPKTYCDHLEAWVRKDAVVCKGVK